MSAAVRNFQIVSWLFWFYLHPQHYFTCYSAYKRLPTKKEAYDVHLLALFNLCCCYEGLFTSFARVEMLNYKVSFLLFGNNVWYNAKGTEVWELIVGCFHSERIHIWEKKDCTYYPPTHPPHPPPPPRKHSVWHLHYLSTLNSWVPSKTFRASSSTNSP